MALGFNLSEKEEISSLLKQLISVKGSSGFSVKNLTLGIYHDFGYNFMIKFSVKR